MNNVLREAYLKHGELVESKFRNPDLFTKRDELLLNSIRFLLDMHDEIIRHLSEILEG
jgi:hypothetical protein